MLTQDLLGERRRLAFDGVQEPPVVAEDVPAGRSAPLKIESRDGEFAQGQATVQRDQAPVPAQGDQLLVEKTVSFR